MARILFVEPFYGGSHRAFTDGLVRHSRHSFELLTLPGGEWRRRMRRGAQDLALQLEAIGGHFDAVIATGMLDLPVFLALTRPCLTATPVLLYLHENQFTYPRIRGTKFNSWFGQVNYLSALAANHVAFNSAFHRDEFMHALQTLDSQPNNWLSSDLIAAIERKSAILPVGVDLAWLDAHRPEASRPVSAPPLLLWNHRWEFDKSPELFVRTLLRLAAEGLRFEVAVCGEPGDNPVPELANLPALLPDHVVHHGFAPDRETYARILWDADIIVSTARHEFFGVSTIEALHCGCRPILPARQNYPALVPSPEHGNALWHSESEFEAMLRSAITGREPPAPALREHVAQFAWPVVAAAWDGAIDRLCSSPPYSLKGS